MVYLKLNFHNLRQVDLLLHLAHIEHGVELNLLANHLGYHQVLDILQLGAQPIGEGVVGNAPLLKIFNFHLYPDPQNAQIKDDCIYLLE